MKHNCPICKTPTDSEKNADFPFCSERCRLLDLGAWSAEKYVVSEPIFDEEEILEPERRALREGSHKPDESIH
ncbi:MAG TPA: DNA gyrase inhibitor YacG [Candidatus Limnocylindrales bacterium]|nr:DNA gyrase inhibitor YacG [Candidatus Limnocylindrales bacterium]